MTGMQPAVHALHTLMINISDNTATDMLVRRLGPERITATMQELGYQHTRVVAGCRDLLVGILGDAPPSLAPYEMARHMRDNPPHPESASYGGGEDTNTSTA